MNDDDLDAMLSDRTVSKSKSNKRRAGKAQASGMTLQEYETELLRKHAVGFSVGTKRRPGDKLSMTGLTQAQQANQAYTSTSQYLREAVGIQRSRSNMDQSTLGKMGSKPQYKSQEEYYDEVIALKRQIQEVNKDNAELKQLIRRKEEEFIKKHKEVEQLLDPGKNDDIRRTLADGKSDSSLVLHSLKQKILRLEQQCREKEASYNKLQSDLKTTKVDEMKIHLETLFNEVIRLRKEKPVTPDNNNTRVREQKGDSAHKLKLLMATVRKMSAEKASLKAENKSLRIDLNKCLDARDLPAIKKFRGADDNGRRDMMATIARLEKKLQEKENDNSEENNKQRKSVNGKISVEGSMAHRLEMLDKRETELLEEVNRQSKIIKKLREERDMYKNKSTQLQSRKDEEERRERVERGRAEVVHAVRQEQNSPIREKSSRNNSRSSSRTGFVDEEQKRRVEDFKRNRAARQIQREWHHHRDTSDLDDAAELIKSVMIGQRVREQSLARMRDVRVEDSELEDAADLIKTSFLGHKYRKESVNIARRSSRSSSPSGANRILSGRSSPIDGDIRRSSISKSRISTTRNNEDDDDYDDDDDDDKQSVKSKGRKIF